MVDRRAGGLGRGFQCCFRFEPYFSLGFLQSNTQPPCNKVTALNELKSKNMSRSLQQAKIVNFSVLFAGLASLVLLYKYAFRPGKPDPASVKLLKDLSSKKDDDEEEVEDVVDEKVPPSPVPEKGVSAKSTPLHSNRGVDVGAANTSAASVTPSTITQESEETIMSSLHSQIEEIDKRGKKLFKEKKYLDAAEVFSEALDLINSKVAVTDVDKYKSLNRQLVTLMNNRSAMYEKGGMPDLALVGKSPRFLVMVMAMVGFRTKMFLQYLPSAHPHSRLPSLNNTNMKIAMEFLKSIQLIRKQELAN